MDVASDELHHYLLVDAWDVNGRAFFAGPGRRHANPAGAVAVVLALAIPGKLNFDAAVFVGEDFLAGGTHHHGGLRSVNAGDFGYSRGAERQSDRDARE